MLLRRASYLPRGVAAEDSLPSQPARSRLRIIVRQLFCIRHPSGRLSYTLRYTSGKSGHIRDTSPAPYAANG